MDSQDTASSSSEEEPEEEIRSRVPALATTRERRVNAGAKMSSLIQNYAALTQSAAEDNEFYTTAYGGFDEDGDDEEFNENMEEADDELDSDFDVEEEDDAADGDAGEEDDGDERKKRVSRKAKEAYEISADRRNRTAAQRKSAPKQKPKPRPKQKNALSSPKRSAPVSVTRSVVEEVVGKRSLRQRKPVIKDDDEEPPIRKRTSSSRNRSRKRKLEEERKNWTQEELLEEAKETERENLASLQKYQLLELEKSEAKKRAKKSSREISGPFIRFISTSMPIPVTDHSDEQQLTNDTQTSGQKTERTFVVFSDENVMQQVFAKTRERRKRSGAAEIKRGAAVCPISNLRARYFDPVTQMPFASSLTFRCLRTAYCNQLQVFYEKSKTTSSSPTRGSESETGTSASSQKTAAKKDDLEVWLEWKRSQRRIAQSARKN